MTATTPTTEQQRAIEHAGFQNQTLLIACPGSGKSTTLINRILHENLDGSKVIVSTFTQRAGRELRQKLELAGFKPHYCGTDHGLCLRILRSINPRTTVMDEETADGFIQQTIDGLRVKGITVTGVRKAIRSNDISAKIRPVVAAYFAAMRRDACYDYDALLSEGAAQATRYGAGWALYVDEYQDTTREQDTLYDGLPCARRFFVGDPDQSIYSFRGSRIQNILERQGKAATLHLTGNFRSAPAIIQVANDVIAPNRERLAEEPMTAATQRAGTARATFYQSDRDEAAAIVEWAREGCSNGTAVLVRYNHDRTAIEEALRAARIPMPAPIPQPPDIRRLRAFLVVMDQPMNEIAQATYIRTIMLPEAAQKLIEAGTIKINVDRPSDWTGWANLLTAEKFSRGAIAALWDAHQLTGSLEPIEMSMALGALEPAQPFATQIAVLTMHAAKGLEFDRVWVAAADMAEESKNHPSEEERRLFYVAVTRARFDLTISSATRRTSPYTHRPEIRKPLPYVTDAAKSMLTGC